MDSLQHVYQLGSTLQIYSLKAPTFWFNFCSHNTFMKGWIRGNSMIKKAVHISAIKQMNTEHNKKTENAIKTKGVRYSRWGQQLIYIIILYPIARGYWILLSG